MRGLFSTGFFKRNALSSPPGGCARKRDQVFPFPREKRQKVLQGPGIFPQHSPGVLKSGEDDEEDDDDASWDSEDAVKIEQQKLAPAEPNHVDVDENLSCVYPSVIYEGDVATAKLGVGQMVILHGCAMVRVVEGQAAILGYSFPRGTDILVCSSSKLAEVTTIRARHGVTDGRSSGTDANMRDQGGESLRETDLGCQLRFASHYLTGQQMVASGCSGLSFRLEIVGSALGKKRGRQVLEQQSQVQGNVCCSDGNELSNLDSEPSEDGELDASTDFVNKRKVCKGYDGQNRDCSVKRQRVVDSVLVSYSSNPSVTPHGWKEAVETITCGVAVQGMLESLRLLGS